MTCKNLQSGNADESRYSIKWQPGGVPFHAEVVHRQEDGALVLMRKAIQAIEMVLND